MDFVSFAPVALFIVAALSVYAVSKRNFRKKIVGTDINKKGTPIVAESCGGALILSVWILIALFNYLFGFQWKLIAVGAAVTVFAVIGFFDDNKHKFLSKPMSWKSRAIPIAIASLALAAILFPPAGIFDIVGIVWVIVLALFFAGLASFSNTFEGLNGWTVGSSFIMVSIISFAATRISFELSFLFLCLAAIILGLLIFNRYPAKVFPGDSGTLLIGASVAGIALYSQSLMFVVFVFLCFLPHMVDFFLLKMITNRKDASQHRQRPYRLLANGRLTIPKYPDKKERLDFAKLMMKIFGPLYEWEAVIVIWCIVLLNAFFWANVFTILGLF